MSGKQAIQEILNKLYAQKRGLKENDLAETKAHIERSIKEMEAALRLATD